MMRLPVPDAVIPDVIRRYIIRLLQSLTTAIDGKIDKGVPQSSILLASPNGSVYTVAVADDGTLQTEIVYDKS